MQRKTPLNQVHRALGARMVEFAGWDMPVQYAGPIAEHLAVRETAGLFDVSHMGEIEVRGREAGRLVDLITANDPKQLDDNQVQYSLMLNEDGGVVDDLLVYRIEPEHYLLVVNAGTTEKDFEWVARHADGMDCQVSNTSGAYALIAIQGPSAERVLQELTPTLLDRIPSFWSQRAELDGVRTRVSRTGYTGEDGFEIFCRPEDAAHIWNRLLVEGARDGLAPCGLAARNTLRLEAKLALYGNDIDDTTNALEAGLGWVVKLDKGDFVGRDALRRTKEAGLARRLVGFEMVDRAPARDGYPVADRGGERIGVVTSGSPAPYLKKNIGLAYLPATHAKVGTEIDVIVRERPAAAVVVKTPFYKRQRVFD
jgi:aminomethyltransferase